jgi:hypothetical protein
MITKKVIKGAKVKITKEGGKLTDEELTGETCEVIDVAEVDGVINLIEINHPKLGKSILMKDECFELVSQGIPITNSEIIPPPSQKKKGKTKKSKPKGSKLNPWIMEVVSTTNYTVELAAVNSNTGEKLSCVFDIDDVARKSEEQG